MINMKSPFQAINNAFQRIIDLIAYFGHVIVEPPINLKADKSLPSFRHILLG